jgi:transcription antitermination factor NusG
MQAAADWIVAMTHPSRELTAARNVRRQDRECYLPQFFDRVLKRRRPLFSSYLFVYAPDHSMGTLRSTIGISRVIGTDDKPFMLENTFIEGLQARENENGVISLEHTHRGFRRGDKVRVCYGPMNNVDAIFECATARERVKVLLNWLGTKVPVIVPIEHIECAA